MLINKNKIILILIIVFITLGGIYAYKNVYFGHIQNRDILKYFNENNIKENNAGPETLKKYIPSSYNIPSNEYRGLYKNTIYKNLINYNNEVNILMKTLENEINNKNMKINTIRANIVNFIDGTNFIYSISPISEYQKYAIKDMNKISLLLYNVEVNNDSTVEIIDNSDKEKIIVLINEIRELTSNEQNGSAKKYIN